jgi:hypothetical protein
MISAVVSVAPRVLRRKNGKPFNRVDRLKVVGRIALSTKFVMIPIEPLRRDYAVTSRCIAFHPGEIEMIVKR